MGRAELADGMTVRPVPGETGVPRSHGGSFLSRGKLVGVVLHMWLESLHRVMAFGLLF